MLHTTNLKPQQDYSINLLTETPRAALPLIRSLASTVPHDHYHRFFHQRRRFLCTRSLLSSTKPRLAPPFAVSYSAATAAAQHRGLTGEEDIENLEFSKTEEDSRPFAFDGSFDSSELRRFDNGKVEVKELEELPEQWRRSKLAWLCKELPAHKPAVITRVLNAQRKWIRQDDVTYLVVHCLRIRENETAFKIYKWMMQQHWFEFDFALSTKLADYMGKERKYLKCREIFNDIINQGRVPSESTFHILVVAYLSSSSQDVLGEACSIYNHMIQLGGYKPRLSLHNSLFKALVSKPAGSCKHFLKQAEFIFQNLTASGLEIHKDIYGGLLWLHSYQDVIDKERISSLRAEMQSKGIEESSEVLVSILRACSKDGDLVVAERIWMNLLSSNDNPPTQAFVYFMEVYAKVGEPMKSLDIFRGMQKQLGSTSVIAYHKIIEVLSKAQNIELAEALMEEFRNSGLKPLMPSFIDVMGMYSNLSLHDKLESTFFDCLQTCHPNRTVYQMYLDSLLQVGNIEKAEEIFNEMLSNEAIGLNTRSCNAILGAYLFSGEYVKAEKIYDLMCQKKYDIEAPLMEKLEYIISLSRKSVKKPISLKLSKDQREVLVGLFLGGLRIELDEERRNHVIHFEFTESSIVHSTLRRHIYDQYYEWLATVYRVSDGADVPCKFTTIPHSYFTFYAEQFWPRGQPTVPKLIHRWLTPRALAYWYMYGGHRTSSGDILLKAKGDREGVEKIVKTLKGKSLGCRVKRKGRVYWIGFLRKDATWFWKLIEPFVQEDLKVLLEAGCKSSEDVAAMPQINFDSTSDSNTT